MGNYSVVEKYLVTLVSRHSDPLLLAANKKQFAYSSHEYAKILVEG